MAALALKGSLRGPSFTAAGLPGCQNPPPHSRFRDHRSSAVSLAWKLGRTKLEATDQHKRRQEAREKRSRDLVDGLIEYISSDSENYKYVIIASKENANMIMEEGFISSGARDEILDDLERIEKDIKDENFQWGNNKDIRTDIIEALIDIVEGPAKRLDAVISHYDQMLTVLNLWCNDSTDKFVTQIKELQVELVLLAIRNEGLVVPCDNRNAGCILLGDMVLSKVEQDSSKRFLRAYELVPVMIKAAKEFARNSFFDHEKFLGFLASGYIGGPELAGFRASKELERLYGGEAVVKQDFKSHSDDTVGKLLELLRRLFQSEQKK
ncbi:hypothetical protein ACQ4PT_011917 [Festuca glaucescens]